MPTNCTERFTRLIDDMISPTPHIAMTLWSGLTSLTFFLALVIPNRGLTQAPRLDSLGHAAMAKISTYELRRHLEFLGSDALEGRGTGTPAGY
ncbi:hypothetical protein HUU05_22210, partial [candidate division KSB1 bacterium]|nr:hypothetical protein [candidate division KSB1 bacterium]